MKSIRFINEETAQQFCYSVPGEWMELNRKQLFFLIDLVDSGITPEEIKLKMLLFCIGGRVIRFRIDNSYTIKIGKNKFNFTAEELTVIGQIFGYLFTEVKETIHINPSSFINLFPVIRIGWIKLYGPADGLTDMNYQRFAEILDCVSNMDKDFSKLDDFISYMYRRKNGKASRFTKYISRRKKIATLWFYLGCMNIIQYKFPLVFSGDTSGNVADGQMRIIDALAKNDVSKKKSVQESNLYDALYTLQIAAEQAEELNKQK